jgi:hypothetical protein
MDILYRYSYGFSIHTAWFQSNFSIYTMDILYRYSIFYTGMNVATLDQDSGLQQKLFIVVDLTREKSLYPLPEPQGVEEKGMEEDAEGEQEEPAERLREETRGGEGRWHPLPEPQGLLRLLHWPPALLLLLLLLALSHIVVQIGRAPERLVNERLQCVPFCHLPTQFCALVPCILYIVCVHRDTLNPGGYETHMMP